MTPLIRDLSTPEAWQFAVGSQNFVIRVFAVVPAKGSVEIASPVVSIQSPLSPAALPYEHAREFAIVLGKAVGYGDLMIRASQFDSFFYAYGRRFWVRGREGVFQLSGAIDNGDVEMFVEGMPDQKFKTIPMDLVPIIEVSDT